MKYGEMLAGAQKVKGFRDLTPFFYEFKKRGDSFVGRLVNVAQVESGLSKGVYNQYLFETDGGLIKCAFGAATDKEAGSMMQVSRVYAVEFLGQEKITGGRSVNKFKILEIDEAALPREGEAGEDTPF